MMKVISTTVLALSGAFMFQGCKDAGAEASDLAEKYNKAAEGHSVSGCQDLDEDLTVTAESFLQQLQNKSDNNKGMSREKFQKNVEAWHELFKARTSCYAAHDATPQPSNEDIYYDACINTGGTPKTCRPLGIFRH